MCTTIRFMDNESYIAANNQDIFLEEGVIFTNNRGAKKSALIMPPEKSLEWVSKYGSISFCQCSKENPSGGMNEEGFVVTQMTLMETVYPPYDERPAVGQMQLIQYLLDTCKKVDEALDAMQRIRISQATWTIHYMLFDRDGQSAIIEFLDGKIVVYKDEDLKIKALANSIYAKSLHYIGDSDETIEEIRDPYERNSVERFIRAVDSINEMPCNITSLIDYTLESLKRVRMDTNTWSLVYDIRNMKVHVSKNFQGIKYFEVKKLDFSKGSTPKALDVSSNLSGDVSDMFEEYTVELNRKLINSFYRNETVMNIMKLNVPDELLEYLAHYPDNLITVADMT